MKLVTDLHVPESLPLRPVRLERIARGRAAFRAGHHFLQLLEERRNQKSAGPPSTFPNPPPLKTLKSE
jgi:hypothetical protein